MRDDPTLPLLLGTASGIRSTAGLAALGTLSPGPSRPGFDSRSLRLAAELALAGEAVVDKLDFLPRRTRPFPLAGRALMGGTSAAVAARWVGGRWRSAAALGAAAAVGAAWLATSIRAAAHRRGVPDLVPALLEDAAAASLGAAARGRVLDAVRGAVPLRR